MILFLSFTVIGLVCMTDASTATTTLGNEIIASLDYLSQRLNDIGPNILKLSPTANAIVDNVNSRLDGVTAVTAAAKRFDQSLASAAGLVQNLQFLVEGCTAAVPVCNQQQNPAGWNKCVNGRHTGSVGKGAVMSSGATNPACKDASGAVKSCPCCTNCTATSTLLADSQGKVPASFDAFQKQISPAEINKYLNDAANSAINLVSSIQSFVSSTRDSVKSAMSSLDSDGNKSLRNGVIFGIWAPGWLIAFLALLGLFLSPCAEPSSCAPRSSLAHPGKVGHCLHWTALVLGVLWVTFVALPAFAVLSVVSLPFSDLCRLVPRSGDDPSEFIRVFLSGSTASSSQNVSDVLRRCVLVPGGSLVDASLSDRVDKAFDPLRVAKNRIPNRTISQYLTTQSQAAPFELALGRAPPERAPLDCRDPGQ